MISGTPAHEDATRHLFHSPLLRHIVQETVDFFEDTPVHSLPPGIRFYGPGVYALYYVGETGIYARLGRKNQPDVRYPIYVGQASSSGVRKGRAEAGSEEGGARLLGRLQEHARSISQVADGENLRLADFRCRFVLLLGTAEQGIIRTVESALIARYTPLWNSVVDGFGIRDLGAGRAKQALSEWDSLHPGRRFTQKMETTALPLLPILEKVERALSALAATE